MRVARVRGRIRRVKRGRGVRRGRGGHIHREASPEPGSALFSIGRFDRPAVLLDDPLRDRQAQAGPAGGRVVGPPEPLPQARQVGGLDARPLILDNEQCRPRFRPDANRHGRAGRTVADGIVDQDRHELAQSDRVAADGRRHRIEHNRDVPFHAERTEQRGRVGRHIGEIERYALHLNHARVGASQEQHVLDQGRHESHFGIDVIERLAHLLDPAAPVTSQILDACPNHREWRAQLVAGVGRELSLTLQCHLPALD